MDFDNFYLKGRGIYAATPDWKCIYSYVSFTWKQQLFITIL